MFRADRAEKIGQDTFKKFGIRGTPTVMIFGPDGSEIDWHVGYGPPPEKFHAQVEKSVKGEETFKYYSGLYAKEPKNINAVFNLARKYDRRYIEDKATALYKEVLAIDPDGKLGTTEYGKERVTYTQYAEFQIAAMQAGFGEKSDPGPLKAFIKKYPESSIVKAAYQRLSYSFRSPRASEEAAKFFEEYVGRYPNDPQVISSYVGYIIRTKSNLDRGIELGDKINELVKPPYPEYVKNQAELYALKGDKAKAEELYGKEFMDDQVAMLGYNLIDYANYWVGQNANTDSAVAMAELALKLRPDNTYLIQQAAGIYCKLNQTEKALAIYGPDYIGKSMDKANVLSGYARFWAGQGKNLDSALAAARKCVELSPEDPYGWDVVSQVYLKQKNYDDALKAAQKALDLAEEARKPFFKNRIAAIEKAKAGNDPQ
jgi:tetratricopeptide (TPR) repeat protein